MRESKDRYGGFAGVSLEATGFFRLEGGGQKWRLVDPEGHPFFIVGINHVDDASLKYDENIHIWRERYGSREKWIRDCVVKSLKEWGFNALAWTKERVTIEFRHSPEWTPEEFRVAEMPYIPHMDFVSMESWNYQGFYPDVFSKAFEERCDYQARYRKYDPNHLMLGDRLNGDSGISEAVLEAMEPFVDVLSVQYFSGYEEMMPNLRKWQGIVDKPVLPADFGCRCPTHFRPNDHREGIMNQADRARFYIRTLKGLLKEPWFIGWHWCSYVENPARSNGLKDPWDEPHRDFVEPVGDFNRSVYDFQR